MNTFWKIHMVSGTVVAFGLLAIGTGAAPTQAGLAKTASLPELSALTAQVTDRIGDQIAAELKTTLAQIASAPRPAHGARPASVFITESNAIVVEATRLPRLDSVADAHTAKPSARIAL